MSTCVRILAIALVIALAGCTSQVSTPSQHGQHGQGLLPSKTTFTATPPQPLASGLLPNSKLTPGAINRAVTQSTINTTICQRGWTRTIRPPVNYTQHLKLEQLQTGYITRGITDPKAYEEDHLIPLELGGNPTSVKNLWPELWSGAHKKDRLENKLKYLVCGGTIPLKLAQQAIAYNWVMAYHIYIG